MKNIPVNELLKQRRLEKDISIETLFKEAHIPSKFVYMLENGEWDSFPSEVHLKGFLKMYTEYLKIEPELVEKCIKEIEDSRKKNTDQNIPAKHLPQRIFKADRSIYLLIFLVIALIVIYLLILYLLA